MGGSVRIVKNELGGSATKQELRGGGLGVREGHNGMDRGTGGLTPPPPRQFKPCGEGGYQGILREHVIMN